MGMKDAKLRNFQGRRFPSLPGIARDYRQYVAPCVLSSGL